MTQQAKPPSNQPSSTNNLKKWMLPLVAVVVAGVAGMQFLGNKKEEIIDSVSEVKDTAAQVVSTAAESTPEAVTNATQSATETITSATKSAIDAVEEVTEDATHAMSNLSAEALKAAQDAMPAGVELNGLTDGLNGILSSTKDALAGITDIDSAKSALPSIETASEKLSRLSDVITRLPDAAKGPITSIVNSGIEALKPQIDKVTAIPGVAELVQPVMGPLLDKLQGLDD